MIIYIYGDDSYRIRQKLNEYLEGFAKEHGGDLDTQKFNIKEKESFENLKNFISISDMFSQSKLAIVDNILLPQKKELLEFIKDNKIFKLKDIVLIIVDEKVESDFKKEILKIADKKDEINNFPNLISALSWMTEEAKKREVEIDRNGLKLLFEGLDQSTGKISSEIEKLSLYNPKGKITENEIFDICPLKKDVYVFSIFDAFFSRNKKRAVYLFTKAIRGDLDGSAVFNLLVDQIRTAAYIISNREKDLGKVSPYKLKKIKEKLGNFPKGQILTFFSALSDIDDAVKNGRIDYETAIERLLMA